MSNPTVVISVINWNTTAKTVRCVQMLQQQTYSHRRIVVVDNGSQSEAVAQLRVELPDDVHLIESPENLGYAGGHGLAVKLALEEGYACFWLLNNDVIIRPETLQSYIEAYEQYGEALYGTAPLQEVADLPVAEYPVDFHRKYFNPDYREIIFDPRTTLAFGKMFASLQPQPVAAVSGSSIFLPLSLVREHGFMDERYFMYAEEIDYCFRVRRAGVKVMVVPAAYILHEHAGSSKSNERLRSVMTYYRLRNQLIRIQRYGTRFDLLKTVTKDILLLLIAAIKRRWHHAGFIRRAIQDGLRGKLGKTYPPEAYL